MAVGQEETGTSTVWSVTCWTTVSDEARPGESRIRVDVEALAARDSEPALLDEVCVEITGGLERLWVELRLPSGAGLRALLLGAYHRSQLRFVLTYGVACTRG